MIKTLLLFALAFGVYLLVRFIMKRVNEIRLDATEQAQPHETNRSTERMVSCAECGLRLPESEAISLEDTEDLKFCSEAHKQAYLKKHPDA